MLWYFTKPKEDIDSFAKGSVIAPTPELISPDDFQNIKGMTIVSRYSNVTDVLFWFHRTFVSETVVYCYL